MWLFNDAVKCQDHRASVTHK